MCDIVVDWDAPRPNGAPLTEYAIQIRTLPAWVDEDGVIHRGHMGADRKDAAATVEGSVDEGTHLSVPTLGLASVDSLLPGELPWLGGEGESSEEDDRPRRPQRGRPLLPSTAKAARPSQELSVDTGVRPLPDLTMPTTALNDSLPQEPSGPPDLASLDHFHPFMWQCVEWVRRPVPARSKRWSRRRSSGRSHASSFRSVEKSSHSGTDVAVPSLPVTAAMTLSKDGLSSRRTPATPSERARSTTPSHRLQLRGEGWTDRSDVDAWAHPVLAGSPSVLQGARARLSTPDGRSRRTPGPAAASLDSVASAEFLFSDSLFRSAAEDSEEDTSAPVVVTRPPEEPEWYNCGEYVTAPGTRGRVNDVACERDVFVRVFARNRFGWSRPSDESPPYWMPDCPSVMRVFPRALRITLGSRGSPPFQIQTQICTADVWNGAPLDWTPVTA